MNIGLVTIAAFLLLLPGVGFIVGVNFADKNVREIVFRNTPAEIGYVVFVSVLIHLILLMIPHFNVAKLYVYSERFSSAPHKAPSLSDARSALALALAYFLISGVLGFLPGFGLGLTVRRARARWIFFFVKHRWMIDLIPTEPDEVVFARVLLKNDKTISPSGQQYPAIIEGLVRDCFFAADGTLLYIVFRSSAELKSENRIVTPYLDVFLGDGRTMSLAQNSQLVLEGREISIARYYRRSLPISTFEEVNLNE